MTVLDSQHRATGQLPVTLRDGGTVLLRPLRTGETTPLLEVFAGMSAASRADRYLVGLSRLPASMLAALTSVDGCQHVAWLGTVDGQPAGIARYLRTGHRAAEVAFEVVDAHQGRGVGSALLDATLTTAALRGITRIEATVAPANQRSLRILRQIGIVLHDTGGLLEGDGPLRLPDPARVDRDRVAALVLTDSTAGAPELRTGA